MKNTLFALFLFVSTVANAQLFQIGPRFGVSSSNIKVDQVTNANMRTISQSDARLGFHAGLYTRVTILGFYVQPELLFTSTSSEIQIQSANATEISRLNFARLDVPVLVGKRFFGFARANIGPVFSTLLQADIRSGNITEDIREQYAAATVGFQMGVGLDIWKLSADLKYEGSFSALGESLQFGGQTFATSTRPSQFILSVGYRLF
jgi:hypothetical protein